MARLRLEGDHVRLRWYGAEAWWQTASGRLLGYGVCAGIGPRTCLVSQIFYL